MTRGASQLTTKMDGNRPPINGDTPVANKTPGQCLNAMLDTSSWIQLFAPKRPCGPNSSKNSSSCELDEYEPTEDTVSLLMAMGMEAHAYPSSTALADWTVLEAGTELQRCNRKLKTAFGSKGVGAGRQPVARSAGERLNPANIPRPPEQSPYFHDSHIVTPRSESRKAHVAREAEQAESTANTRPGTGTSSSRCQAADDNSSSDEDNPFYQDDDENDATTELEWQIRELPAMEEMDPTPRFEIAQHRPLGKITPFRGEQDESENSMQWLRCFVYEMIGTHTPPNEWCMAFQLSLRVHWHRALSRKTKRTWSLLSDKFISYYCSQFSQSASTRYKRSEKEHIRDANIKFERSGREANEHVKHFLETCGDRDLERQLTPMQLRDIHTLKNIVSDIQKEEKRVPSRSSSQSSSSRDDKRHTSSSGSYGRHDGRSRSQERSRSEPRHISRVALVDASVTDLITELQTHASSKDPTSTRTTTRMMIQLTFMRVMKLTKLNVTALVVQETRCKDAYSDQDERLVAAANDNERRNTANGTFAKSDKRPQNNGQQSSGFGQGGFRLATQSGSRFNDSRGGCGFQGPTYGPCAACGGQSDSSHFCFRRYWLCQQLHDFGKCEAFDELDKILWTNVDKKNITPELQKLVFGGQLNYVAHQPRLGWSLPGSHSQTTW
ncbi:LOW QUALITY PROTEIN: hypothetical protein PHMEG_00020806 [Phytophthora megakarya]|uniref:Retrotransposon gag domain-containing protein n=1 Tax=Phytophthora megakarya TaxID=4795 RepID=A0A225VMW9_9STRA|nr:LOW QUALITY PROTEIN: hypothetical protein PHMEG_00020806 [Phytophthora megakarya]